VSCGDLLSFRLEGRARYAGVAFLLLYLAVYFYFDRLQFEVRKDELHFWPTSLSFSRSLIPSLEQLRSYDDLNTPLPFVTFGLLERLFHQGIWLGRLLNFALSFLCLLTIAFPKSTGGTKRSFLCAAGLLLCPYYFAVSTHLYTDMIALSLSLAGVAVFLKGRAPLSGLVFVAAIAARQYSVVFPAAIALWIALQARTVSRFRGEWKRWGPMGAAAATLFGWFLFFGGPGPRVAIEHQFIATTSALALLPHNTGYFLACIGLYYVTPELFFFRSARDHLRAQIGRRVVWAALGGLALLFVLFPPLRNPPGYFWAEMGYFDKALRLFLGDVPRVLVLFAFALLAIARFTGSSLASLIVLTYALVMMKAHIAWDKYTLPVLAVLWWLRAYPKTPAGVDPLRD
jgi:hypothetical protein